MELPSLPPDDDFGQGTFVRKKESFYDNNLANSLSQSGIKNQNLDIKPLITNTDKGKPDIIVNPTTE